MKFILITFLGLTLLSCKKEQNSEKISTETQAASTYCIKNKISSHPDYDLWVMDNQARLVVCEWADGDNDGETQWVNLYQLNSEGGLTPFLKDTDGKDFRKPNLFLNVDVEKVSGKEVKVQKIFHGIHSEKNQIISEIIVRCEGKTCDASSEKCVEIAESAPVDEASIDALEKIFSGKQITDANLEAQISATVDAALRGNKRAWELLQNNNTVSLKSKLAKEEEASEELGEGESFLRLFQDGKEVIQKLKQQGCIKISEK